MGKTKRLRGGEWRDYVYPNRWNIWKGDTLKKRIQKRTCKKDICCEGEIKRPYIIELIIENYKKINILYREPSEEYLNYINNDLLGFIGYKVDLDKNDKEGAKLWLELDKEMMNNNKVEEWKVRALLKDVPLIFLMAFLGYSTYRLNELQKL